MKTAKRKNSVPQVIVDLHRAVEGRHFAAALEMFRAVADLLEKSPSQVTPRLLDTMARLLDRAPQYLQTVEKCIKQFRGTASLAEMTMVDNAHLKLAEAIVHFHKRDYAGSIESFRSIVWLSDECGREDLRVITLYYLARALYNTGAFTDAHNILLSVEPAALNSPAAFDLLLLKTWLFFSEESGEEPVAILEQAARFLPSEDYVGMANVMSFRARLARRQGHFEDAATIAREAILVLEKNNDYVQPLLPALYEQHALVLLLKAQNGGLSPSNDEFQLLRDAAFDSLTRAQDLCRHQNNRSIARIHYVKGRWYLYLDQLEKGRTDHLEKARREAHLALEAARQIDDHVTSAQIRILLCQIARVRHSPAEAAELALEAYSEAEATGNRRLQARSLIWRAITEADPPLCNFAAAQKHKDEAMRLLRPTDRDYVRWEFSDLESHLKTAQFVDNQISLPVITMDDLLSGQGLEHSLQLVEAAIVKAVYRRTGSIYRTAQYLRMGRTRLRKVLKAELSVSEREAEQP